jgi:hypothetical protein
MRCSHAACELLCGVDSMALHQAVCAASWQCQALAVAVVQSG